MIKYSVTVESVDSYYPLKQASFTSKAKAIKQAQEWAKEHDDKQVFIKFTRSSDGQVGFINKNGANITGKSWTSEV